MRFAGRAVVVTGATGDIGPAVVRAFAAEGADIGIVYRTRVREAEALAAEVRAAGRRATLAMVDLTASSPQLETAVREAAHAFERALGRVDVLVGLAGLRATESLWQKRFEDVTASDLHAAFAIDTVGTFLFAQALAPALRRTRGAVVVMSSAAAFHGDTLGLAFAPAKSANAGLVKLLARVLAPDVRVNGVAPGAIDSAWMETLSAAQRAEAAAAPLLGRVGKPEEVARVILDLSAPGYVNGQVLAVDGGILGTAAGAHLPAAKASAGGPTTP
jgi:3-oxoacyl-[acyl-carrier protein] reductase